jgi:hypothetical protein
MLKKLREVMEWLESGGSRYCRCGHSNKPSCSTKGGELLYQLTDYQLLKEFVPRYYVIYSYKLTKVAGGKVMYVVASFNILNPTCVIRS